MFKKRPSEEIFNTVNRDESGVPQRDIPSVLIKADGSKVANAWEWMNFRRPEVMNFYRDEVYGEVPIRPEEMICETVSIKADALDGIALRKEIQITFRTKHGGEHSVLMLLYMPNNAAGRIPVVLGLNFRGNHSTTMEDDCLMTGRDLDDNIIENTRGIQQGRWQYKMAVERGFAVATVCYHDIFPDFAQDKAWEKSIYNILYPEKSLENLKERFSAIGAWAWGLSRMLDALEGEEGIDTRRAMVIGHSRLGKTSLWAGVNDQRFGVVVSNDSGHGGAALFKRCLGESIEFLETVFPHWFVSDFEKYVCKDADLEFDQNFLLSLIAPRHLCIGSATGDWWADPKGEFLAGVHASEVYRLFGVQGMPSDVHPEPDVNLTGEISYHMRTGEHNITAQDWDHYLSVAEKVFC